jgi:hypothetical protein
MSPGTKAVAAEFVGTAALLAAVVGSGIMAERLSAGNAGVALLANALVTGFALYVLITISHRFPARTSILSSRRRPASAETCRSGAEFCMHWRNGPEPSPAFGWRT